MHGVILYSEIDVWVLQGPKGPSTPSSAGFRALGVIAVGCLQFASDILTKKWGVEAKGQIFLARPKVLTAETWRKTKDDL